MSSADWLGNVCRTRDERNYVKHGPGAHARLSVRMGTNTLRLIPIGIAAMMAEWRDVANDVRRCVPIFGFVKNVKRHERRRPKWHLRTRTTSTDRRTSEQLQTCSSSRVARARKPRYRVGKPRHARRKSAGKPGPALYRIP